MTTNGADTIEIPVWANGPDASGNGGWSAGLLAEQLGADAIAHGVSVSLRLPPPIGRPLRVAPAGSGRDVFDDDSHGAGGESVLVMHAEPSPTSLDAPDVVRAIDADVAGRASAGFPFREHHPFPRCVSCGIARDPGEVSLELHCGPVDGVAVDGSRVFADAWIPSADVPHDDDSGEVTIPAMWSALDCPSAAPVADPHAVNPSVLARITARVATRARVGERCVLAAWHVSSDGRQHVTRSVMVDAGGTVIAAADALWIEVRPR
ncbi:MAG: hypothetical protein KDC46_07025 [Thermoleophilia bacterium]|nr:hypothetical protein [Thermoleophilia bacterium]